MKHLLKISTTIALLTLISGCATPKTSADNRDTTGAFAGVWQGNVGGPRAQRVDLAGNWFMNCNWEPFSIFLNVKDGTVQLNEVKDKAYISTKGSFRLDLTGGEGSSSRGVMPGNSKFVNVFSGSLAGDKPKGRYSQYLPSIGGNGCSANIEFSRYKG